MILMYHNIGREKGFNTVSFDNFKEQIDFVRSNYEIVDIDQYVSSLNKVNNYAVISVDDAYESFRSFIFPYLHEHNIPSVLFIPWNHIGSYNIWDPGKTRLNILDKKALIELSKNELITFGSHGLTHKRISGLSDEEIENEITLSKEKIETLLSRKVDHFSFPFGQLSDLNKLSIDVIKKRGYRSACTTRYKNTNYGNSPHNLFRLEVEPDDSIEVFKMKCKNTYNKKYFKRLIKETLIKMKLYK